MSLSINTAVNATSIDENVSPLGKRKTDQTSTAGRSAKRSPLAAVRENGFDKSENDDKSSGLTKVSATPSKPVSIRTISTPYSSSSKFRGKAVSKEEVQATDEGRASVNKLSEWLANESAKKPKPKTIVHSSTPVRFRVKPKIKKEDVMATDDKQVSVKKLSEWISDDPFEKKKMLHIRSGAKVIAKSRNFEPETKVLATSKGIDIKAGSVTEKQEWLSRAFSHDEDDSSRKPAAKDKMSVPPRPYQIKNKKQVESPDKCLKSVHDKKEWLSNAFRKDGHTIQSTKSFESSTPGISKCASADEAIDSRSGIPAISHQASYDGMKTPFDGTPTPVRLYQNLNNDDDNSPDQSLKSVQAKQEWLSSAFKKQDTNKTNQKIRSSLPAQKPEKQAMDATAETIKPAPQCSDRDATKVNSPDVKEERSADVEPEIVSVADRAKWLRGAFK